MDPQTQAKTLYLRVNREAPTTLARPSAESPSGRPHAAVRRSEIHQVTAVYQQLLHGMYDGVLIVDLQGRLLEVNAKACRMFRGEKETLCRCTIDQILDATDAPMLQSVCEALAGGQHVVVETDARRLDGTVFACEAAAMAMGIAGERHLCFFVHDISDRKQAEEELSAAKEELERRSQALQASEETLRTSLEQVQAGEREIARERDLLRALMDNTPDRVFIKTRECRYLRISRALAAFHGLVDPADAVGKSDFDFFPEEKAREFYADDERVMETGEPLVDKVQRIVREDGSVSWSSVTKAPIRDVDGTIIGLVGISRDITERMETEEKLKAAHAQLEKAQRLEATALFAGQIAHDLNNLLVPLLIYPDIIKKSLDPEGQAFKDLETMQNMAQQIADINQDLMALARRGKVKTELVDVNSAMMDVAEFFRRAQTQTAIRFDCYPLAGVATVMFDRPQLTRVLQNLVQNAVDAVGDEGHITLRTENVEVNGPIGANAQPVPGRYVRITVSDDGCGIPDSIREKIFDPFFTTKDGQHKRRRGTGLGLSVVYGIVTDHSGYLDLESQPGKGTSFHLYFPVTEGTVEKTAMTEIRGGDEWILIAEDDPLQTRVVSRVLNELGYRVTPVSSGAEAVAAIEGCAVAAGGRGVFPDLVLLDLVLDGEMDGAEAYRRMKAVHPGLKAVTISGYREPERLARAKALGASQHLAKPVTIASLAHAVRTELDRAPKPSSAPDADAAPRTSPSASPSTS